MYLQLLAHLLGDFVLQNGWMANNKEKSSKAALVHVLIYTFVFYWIFNGALSVGALAVIGGSHFLIDRFALAKKFVYLRECYCGDYYDFRNSQSGFSPDTPPWLAKTLCIIIDNTAHLCINYWAITNF